MKSIRFPSPPLDDRKPKKPKKRSRSQPNESARRAPKQANSGAGHDQIAQNTTGRQNSHHKRVWKACERCRMKKTRCDGEFPCKRCKDNGLVCTAGHRKKVEYKQLPRGYAEVLEHTQLTLIATVHKLYSMVRNSQAWELGEPDLNDAGLPVVHNIADKLGCIRQNEDTDLPAQFAFPEDAADIEDVIAHANHHNQSSPSEGNYFHPELDYRRLAFGKHTARSSSAESHDLDVSSSSTAFDQRIFPTLLPSSLPSNFTVADDWSAESGNLTLLFPQQSNGLQNLNALEQSLSLIEPLPLSNAGMMMEIDEAVIYSNFKTDISSSYYL